MQTSDFIGIIPARYGSTRFPGKPLALLGGMPVIERVWRQVSKVLTHVVVATDDERIARAVSGFGGEAVMTSAQHRSGTDRCGEVMQTLARQGEHYDVVINLQGDEPFVKASQLQELVVNELEQVVVVVGIKLYKHVVFASGKVAFNNFG